MQSVQLAGPIAVIYLRGGKFVEWGYYYSHVLFNKHAACQYIYHIASLKYWWFICFADKFNLSSNLPASYYSITVYNRTTWQLCM